MHYEIIYGKSLTVEYIRTFGNKAYVCRPKDTVAGNLTRKRNAGFWWQIEMHIVF